MEKTLSVIRNTIGLFKGYESEEYKYIYSICENISNDINMEGEHGRHQKHN